MFILFLVKIKSSNQFHLLKAVSVISLIKQKKTNPSLLVFRMTEAVTGNLLA